MNRMYVVAASLISCFWILVNAHNRHPRSPQLFGPYSHPNSYSSGRSRRYNLSSTLESIYKNALSNDSVSSNFSFRGPDGDLAGPDSEIIERGVPDALDRLRGPDSSGQLFPSVFDSVTEKAIEMQRPRKSKNKRPVGRPDREGTTTTVAPNIANTTVPASLRKFAWITEMSHDSSLAVPSGRSGGGRFLNFGFGKANVGYQNCITILGSYGRCRFLEHCPLPILQNYKIFLDNICVISNRYVGTCCPHSFNSYRPYYQYTSPYNQFLRPFPAASSPYSRPFNRPLRPPALPLPTRPQSLPPQKPGFPPLPPPLPTSPSSSSQTLTPQPPTLPLPPAPSSTPSSQPPLPQSQTSVLTPETSSSTHQPQSTNDCGHNVKLRTRIVGGRPADPKEWPWMAALLKDNDKQYCGGALISNSYVLTAAHCVKNYQPQQLKVRLGEYDFNRDSAHEDLSITSIKMHPQFNAFNYHNDIALLHLERAVDYSDHIQPVCLPPTGHTFTGRTATVTGWGTIAYGGPASNVLREVDVPVWDQQECDSTFTQSIPDFFLCAGPKTGGIDSCQGDSGGPLHYQIEPDRWAVIGVVSWGIKCAQPGYPGVYTRVNKYLQWIKENT